MVSLRHTVGEFIEFCVSGRTSASLVLHGLGVFQWVHPFSFPVLHLNHMLQSFIIPTYPLHIQ